MIDLRSLFSLKILSSTYPEFTKYKNLIVNIDSISDFDKYLGLKSSSIFSKDKFSVKLQVCFDGKPFYSTEYIIGNYEFNDQGLLYHIFNVIDTCENYIKEDKDYLKNLISYAFGKLLTLNNDMYNELSKEAKNNEYVRNVLKVKE